MKVKLKLSLKHKGKHFVLGRHKITHQGGEYDLNEAEAKELKGKGPQHWLIMPESKKPAQPKEQK